MYKITCLVQSCNRVEYARGWCGKHYKHWNRFGHPLPQNRRPGGPGKPGGTCSVEGCEELFYCRTYCQSHGERWRRNGDPLGGNRSPRAQPIKTKHDTPVGHRYCRKCDTVKPVAEFYKSKTLPGGIGFYCKVCIRTDMDDRKSRDPERYLALSRRRAHRSLLLKKFGMTRDEYDEQIATQGGVCKICKQPETAETKTGVIRMMAVDHCHVSGRVRGIICDACNRGLGAFKDNVASLAAAIEYLTVAAP